MATNAMAHSENQVVAYSDSVSDYIIAISIILWGGGSHSEIGHYRIGLVWSVPPPLLLVGEFSIT